MPLSERIPDLDIGDDLLFDVYAQAQFVFGKPDKLFGLATEPGKPAVVVEGIAGQLVPRRIAGNGYVRLLSERLRQGYEHHAGRRFFNPRSQQFTLVHPDMEWKGLKVVLLSRQISIPEAAAAVAQVVKSTPASCITSEEIDGWVQQQQRNATHVVAFSDHPIWALALAEVVLTKGWDWRAGPQLQSPPGERPSQEPQVWTEWLQQVFERKQIVAAQAGLGWTLEALLQSSASASPTTGSLAALL